MILINKKLSEINVNLKFKANAIVEGFISGLHQSPYHGFSVEFSDHKAYSNGDDINKMDWKLFSKTDKYYIKRYEEETNVRAYFLVDCSNSMAYMSESVSKIDYAILLTACLINLSLRQRDATGLVLFSDKIRLSLPAKSKSTWLNQCLGELEKVKCEGETNISQILFKFGEEIRKRSLIIIISDFLDDHLEFYKALNYLKFNKHHCIVFHIIDQQEKEFSFRQESEFIDMETNEILKINPWTIKKEYLHCFHNFLWKQKQMIEKLGFEYQQISTKTPIINSLKTFLTNRRT